MHITSCSSSSRTKLPEQPTQLQLAGSFHIFHQEIKSRLNQPVEAAATTTNNKRHPDIIVHIHTRPIIDMMVWIESD